MSAWRPIESAPMDGTRILAWSREYGQRETYMSKYVQGSPGYAAWEKGDGPLNVGWDWIEPKSNWAFTWNPTHWMPLPAPPTDELDGLGYTNAPTPDAPVEESE